MWLVLPRGRLFRYGFSVAVTCAAVAITAVLEPALANAVLPPAFAAVLLSALVGGAGPGLLSVTVGAVMLKYGILSQDHTLVRLALFVGLGALITWLSASLRRAIQRAEEANRFLDSIVENIPDIVFVKDARSGRFVRINRAGEELLGWRRDEMIGRKDGEMFPPGTVSVRAEILPDEIRFSVSDTGPGIPEDERPHVFDQYWKGKTGGSGGAGLGLAIAKGIVEAHGGRIWVESRAGGGATFSFTLPAG
jgi:signal transduction histidine kinase